MGQKDEEEQLPAIFKKQRSRTVINKNVVKLMEEYPTLSPTPKQDIKEAKEDEDGDINTELVKIYNDYVSEKQMKPANKYELANYMKENGLGKHIEHSEISQFFSAYQPDDVDAVWQNRLCFDDAVQRSDTETSVEDNDANVPYLS